MWSSIRFPSLFLWLALALGGFYFADAHAALTTFTNASTACGKVGLGNKRLLIDNFDGNKVKLFWVASTCSEIAEVGISPWGSRGSCTAFPVQEPCSSYPLIAVDITQSSPASCPTGTTEDVDGQCIAEMPCPPAGSSAIPSGQVGYGESAAGTNPTLGVICGANQCGIKINQATSIPIGGGLQANYISNASYTGSKVTGACPLVVLAPTPNDPSLPKPLDTVTPDASTPDGVPASQSDCPAGSAFGQVNGVNVCSPPGSQQGYVPDTTTTTNNGIEGSSTKDVVKTVGEDGSVTTTTTTNSTIGGNSSSTTTTSNNGGSNGLNGADGADGKDADPIDFGPAPSAESGDAPTVPGLDPGGGADGAGGVAKTLSIGNHFTGSGSCIADRSVTVLGVTVTVPLSELCPWFDVMYKVVSLMAVFAAMRILVMS